MNILKNTLDGRIVWYVNYENIPVKPFKEKKE